MNQNNKSNGQEGLSSPPNRPEGQGGSPVNQEGLSSPSVKEARALWHCDTYCRKVRYITCEGRASADPSSPNRCPYLDEMLY